MRNTWTFVALILTILLVAPAAGSADADRVLWVENRTGRSIHGLHVSPVESDDWEEDILGEDILEHGDRVEILLSGYEEDQCLFDLLATNPDGTRWALPTIDLCRVFAVTVAPRHQVRTEGPG